MMEAGRIRGTDVHRSSPDSRPLGVNVRVCAAERIPQERCMGDLNMDGGFQLVVYRALPDVALIVRL